MSIILVYTDMYIRTSAHRYHATASPAVLGSTQYYLTSLGINCNFWRTWIVAIPPQSHVNPLPKYRIRCPYLQHNAVRRRREEKQHYVRNGIFFFFNQPAYRFLEHCNTTRILHSLIAPWNTAATHEERTTTFDNTQQCYNVPSLPEEEANSQQFATSCSSPQNEIKASTRLYNKRNGIRRE